MDDLSPSDAEHQEGEEAQQNESSTSLTEPGDEESSKAQAIGCLTCFVVVILALIIPKAIALWQGLHSDGSWVYPPIGILIFMILTVTTLFTGKIPYRSEDMDLRPYPVIHYGAVVLFALAALGMYWLYLAMIFGW